jgi:hypothetical protein
VLLGGDAGVEGQAHHGSNRRTAPTIVRTRVN